MTAKKGISLKEQIREIFEQFYGYAIFDSKKHSLKEVEDAVVEAVEAFVAGLRELRNDFDKIFDDEVKLVRMVCLNVLKQPMYGEKLQDTVIYHMKNYKAKMDKRFDVALEGDKKT